MHNFKNSIAFFTLKIKKVSFYAETTKENIMYNKLLQDIRYKKLIEST